MITLFTETVIDSCHVLEGHPEKCQNLHGHSWLIQVWIQGSDNQKDKVGILFDFGAIKEIKEALDHKKLNDVVILTTEEEKNYWMESARIPEILNPTAENISLWILMKLQLSRPALEFRVRVYETAVGKNTYAQRQSENFDITLL